MKNNRFFENLFYVNISRSLRFHSSLKKTPYEAVFGRKPHSLPAIVSLVEEEDQIEEALTQLTSLLKIKICQTFRKILNLPVNLKFTGKFKIT